MNTNSLNIKLKKILGYNSKSIIIKLLFLQRNKFLLFNFTNRAKKNTVNLNYWLESENLGDLLSPLIVNYMLSLKNISSDKQISQTKHLYGVGSVLTAGIQDCTVWGSGVLNTTITNRLLNRKFDVRSVRGPLTKAVLEDFAYEVPNIFGDPAILLPEIYMPKNITKIAKFGLVMHKDQILNYNRSNEIIEIDICNSDYKGFIDQICGVDIVISSSLHGIIIAETYGIKAILLKPKVDYFKYYDYYFSTSRLQFPIASSIEEAKVSIPIDLPDFTQMRSDIKMAFPYDIYE